jgi:cytochrome c oxidase assembly protein subunit 15
MRVPRLSAGGFRRLTTVNLVLLVAIIVSGAIVRLTNSGLGCRDWPNCSADQFVDVSTHHAAIEQLNRLFSGAIGIPIALALIGAYQLQPRRRDLVRLSWVLLGLFFGEAILGGISVQVKLAWFSVMGHFLLALALVSVALHMRQRAREEEAPRRPIVTPLARRAVAVVYVWTIAAVIAGTFVTAAGPHGGDRDARRLTWPIVDIVRVHGALVDVLVVLALLTAWILARTRAPRQVLVTASLALAAMVAQGVLGYVQYYQEIPAVLVGFHVFGAVMVFGAVQQLEISVRAPRADNGDEDTANTPLQAHIDPHLLAPDGSSVAAAALRDPVA